MLGKIIKIAALVAPIILLYILLAPHPLFFIGAYTEYKASQQTEDFDLTIKIINMNDTHAEVNATLTFAYSHPWGSFFGYTSGSMKNTKWISLNNLTFNIFNNTPAKSNKTIVNINGHDRQVTAYTYVLSKSAIKNITFYIDDEFKWPIQIVITYHNNYDNKDHKITLNIADTKVIKLKLLTMGLAI